MTFSDKLIALRKKAGWSQEELAERLNVSRQSVSKWESAQSMPDIDKILQLSSLFSVTTDCLLKDKQDDPQPAAAQTPSPLPRVTLAQAEDYLTKAQANAPQMALATALCIVSPIPLLALGTVSELGLLGLDDNLAGGLGMIALLVLVAVAVVLFMQCGAAVREYEFLEKEPIETEHGVTALPGKNGKIQLGSAWWFCDTDDGMYQQMKTLARLGLLGNFIGMLTDSRSFLSYTRHELFRRLMCNLIGNWVENGQYPNDEKSLKKIVEGISYYNAKRYFNL